MTIARYHFTFIHYYIVYEKCLPRENREARVFHRRLSSLLPTESCVLVGPPHACHVAFAAISKTR
jgi:hypothetical protein